jgi:chromosome segregation ATPase
MKILATCLNCKRTLLLDQLIEGPVMDGKCPWCGVLLAPDYTHLLLDAARRAEQAGFALVSALKVLRGSWARLRLNAETILGPIREQLDFAAGEATWAQIEGEIVTALELIERTEDKSGLPETLANLDARAGVIEQGLRTHLASVDGIDKASAEEIAASVERIAESAEKESTPEADVMKEISRLVDASRQHGEICEQLSLAEAHLSEAHRSLGNATTHRENLHDALQQLRTALREAEGALAAEVG